MNTYKFTRYLKFNHLFELFLLSAVLAILAIRFYLQLTGFPQIGSSEFHIAHMLWGGLLMLVSILGALTFVNNDLKPTWAVIGGAGFGTFIDEIGKFITQDNDYFYQPTFAVIYVIFVLLFITFRTLIQRVPFTKEEYLINSIEELKEAIANQLDQGEIAKALQYLKHTDPKNPLTIFLRKTFKELTDIPPQKQSLYDRIKSRLTICYDFLISRPWFLKGVAIFFVLRTFEYLFRGSDLLVAVVLQPWEETLDRITTLRGIFPLINALALTLQAGYTIAGTLLLGRSRRDAYRMFRYALLISILLLQVFNFYRSPMLALATTIRDVILFSIMEYMIANEKKAKALKAAHQS